MQDILKVANPTEKEVWLCALLIQPSKGINNEKNHKFFVKYTKDELEVYRNIFQTNNAALVDRFFS